MDISETPYLKVYALPSFMNEFSPLQQYSQDSIAEELEGTYLKAGQHLDILAFQLFWK